MCLVNPADQNFVRRVIETLGEDETRMLPDLDVGERVYFLNAGAYTLSYASHFNGWPPPSVHLVDP